MTSAKEVTIYQKAVRYCSYQERTKKEVQEKLRVWGVVQSGEEVRIIQALQADNFLNEERYVEAFIRGKFLSKRWGKRKMLDALIKKGADLTLIQKGLSTIRPIDYLQQLFHVATQKKQSLTKTNPIEKMKKLTNYLLQKGYEPDLVTQIVREL